MKIEKVEQELEQEFHISSWIIVYKLILGIIELILGLAIYFFGDRIFILYYAFRDGDLLENGPDILVDILEKVLPFFLAHEGFIILILLLLGVTKIAGSIGLYYKQHWGLDLLIGLTFLFLPFDLATLAEHFTLVKLLYFIANLLIALYLVNFKPHHYFRNLKSRLIKK